MINNEYEPTSIDTDVFLSDVPINLIKENLKNQFEVLSHTDNNFVTVFFDNYNISLENCEYDRLSELEVVREDFMLFLLKLFKIHFNIGFPNIDELSIKEQHKMMELVYQYFILNIKKNFSSFIYNYIKMNKESILPSLTKKKDVTTLALKKELSDNEDILLISNLGDIIDNIYNKETDVDEFLSLSLYKNSMENRFIDECYDNFTITGNFVNRYKKKLTDDLKSEIYSVIRAKLIKKSKKKE